MPDYIDQGYTKKWKGWDPSTILHVFPMQTEYIHSSLIQTGQYIENLEEMVQKALFGKFNDSYRMCYIHFTKHPCTCNLYSRKLKSEAIPILFEHQTLIFQNPKPSVMKYTSFCSHANYWDAICVSLAFTCNQVKSLAIKWNANTNNYFSNTQCGTIKLRSINLNNNTCNLLPQIIY